MASYIIHIILTFLSLRLKLAFGQGYTYLGCFYDNNRREALPDLIYCNRLKHPYQTCQNVCGPQSQYCQSQEMTIELCRDICADQNMKYFGLQAGTQCLCGGFFAPYNSLNQPTGENDTCNRPCSGDMSQMCGADFQSSVYQINAPALVCFNPGYVLNGDQSQQDSTMYGAGDVIDFTSVCPPPSIKNGAASITCNASGNWTDPPPTCTVRCATPTAPMHASFSAGQTMNDSYAVNDIVLFDCDNDQTKRNQLLTCGYYGNWEPMEPMEPMVCPALNSTASSATQPATNLATTAATNVSTTTELSTDATSEGPATTESSTMTISTSPSTSSPSTDGQTPGDPSSSPSSVTSNEASSSESMATMTSSPGEQSTATPSATAGSGKTTVDSGRNQSDDMGLIPIIIGAAAGVLVLILVIIVISVCCSRKRKQKTKKIPFDPALGTSFGNPAFEDDEAEESRRGFVQENDYGDRQTYDIGVSDYAMAVDETNRVPPDGKDSPGVNGDGVDGAAYAVVNKNRQGDNGDGLEDAAYAVVNKNRQGANGDGVEDAAYAVVNKNRQGRVTSFKPEDHRVSWATLPRHHNNDINDIYEGNRHSPLIHENGYSEAYYTDPNNQVATPL